MMQDISRRNLSAILIHFCLSQTSFCQTSCELLISQTSPAAARAISQINLIIIWSSCQPLVISTTDHINHWSYQPLIISTTGHNNHWLYQPVIMSTAGYQPEILSGGSCTAIQPSADWGLTSFSLCQLLYHSSYQLVISIFPFASQLNWLQKLFLRFQSFDPVLPLFLNFHLVSIFSLFFKILFFLLNSLVFSPSRVWASALPSPPLKTIKHLVHATKVI